MDPDHLIRESKREEMLTTTLCARALGVSAAFIRGEILEGRLKGRVLTNAGRKRASYRVAVDDFRAYVKQHWPQCFT